MQRLSQSDIEEIIRQEKPGFRVLDETQEPAAARDSHYVDVPVADQTPDIETLRELYLGSRPAGSTSDAPATPTTERDSGETQVVVIVPAITATPHDRGPGPKSVLVSSRTKRVTAVQG